MGRDGRPIEEFPTRVPLVKPAEEESSSLADLPAPVAEKLQFYRSITLEKWAQLHQSAPQYTVYESNVEELNAYGKLLMLLRICLGTTGVVGVMKLIGLLKVGALGTLGLVFVPGMAAAVTYGLIRHSQDELVVKIIYDTKRRMFCFTTVEGLQKLKEDWLYASDIGINLKASEDSSWIYYNKYTKQKYATIEKGKWLNEELFLYALLVANGSVKPKTGPAISTHQKNVSRLGQQSGPKLIIDVPKALPEPNKKEIVQNK